MENLSCTTGMFWFRCGKYVVTFAPLVSGSVIQETWMTNNEKFEKVSEREFLIGEIIDYAEEFNRYLRSKDWEYLGFETSANMRQHLGGNM